MDTDTVKKIDAASQAAIHVLLNNAHGPFQKLPRTAGWGYPEPYTRDLLLSIFGIAVSKNEKLISGMQRVLETLARNQTELGHIPSLVHDRNNRGASDTTPLFLMAVGVYRQLTGDQEFLQTAAGKALTWMNYQSPSNRNLVVQQPTTDWRDEQWTMGYGLYVNTIVYSYLCFLGLHERAELMLDAMRHFTLSEKKPEKHSDGGFVIKHKPYFAFWTFKVYHSDRFDLLGNSLAILTGIASAKRSQDMITWIEKECERMYLNNELASRLPPNFFPFIQEKDRDWFPRYAIYNPPGEYHNGGIWPFICGFYVSALVAAGRHKLAEEKLLELTDLITEARGSQLDYGFNEWHRARDGKPSGEDWQTWSAAMYLYAAECVSKKETPFFNKIRMIKDRSGH